MDYKKIFLILVVLGIIGLFAYWTVLFVRMEPGERGNYALYLDEKIDHDYARMKRLPSDIYQFIWRKWMTIERVTGSINTRMEEHYAMEERYPIDPREMIDYQDYPPNIMVEYERLTPDSYFLRVTDTQTGRVEEQTRNHENK